MDAPAEVQPTPLQRLGLPPVARRTGLAVGEFRRRYGGPQIPVVLGDAMESWPARTRWTLAAFKERYGTDEVLATNRHYRGRRMPLAEYLEYIEAVPWQLMGGLRADQILYLRDWVFDEKHPELLAEFHTPPHFAGDWIAGGLGRFIDQKFRWIYIGPAGAVTPWHQDLMGTHAWLSQIVGRKEWLLTPPGRDPRPLAEAIQRGDDDGIRAAATATDARHVVVGPGDIIFVPALWWHTVTSLEATLSLTVNYANASNIRLFAKPWTRMAWGRLKSKLIPGAKAPPRAK